MKIRADLIELSLAKRGLKKSDLADLLGMTPGGITKLIGRARAGTEFQPAVVHRLAKALRVKPDALIGEPVEARR